MVEDIMSYKSIKGVGTKNDNAQRYYNFVQTSNSDNFSTKKKS
jgi:hypothetical protein